MSKPLENLQILNFEIGIRCNMASIHHECPVNRRDRFQGKPYHLTTEVITETVHKAEELGFAGLISFFRYNEMLMYLPKIKAVMEALADRPRRYLCWTNGLLLDDENASLFNVIHITAYHKDRVPYYKELEARHSTIEFMIRPIVLDDRLNQQDWPASSSVVHCTRPEWIELPVDFAGNVCLCCYDHDAKESLGNIFEQPFSEIITGRYQEVITSLANNSSPSALCTRCVYRYPGRNLW